MGLYSDAFVFLGATGYLAYKKIFPALQAMIRRSRFDIPIIGVAKRDWTSVSKGKQAPGFVVALWTKRGRGKKGDEA